MSTRCARVPAAPREAEEVAVVATRIACAGLLACAATAQAAVLPEERGDIMYHRYDGGGVTVDGPAVLVRKNFKETYSVNASYYVDNVSSASIDVVTTGASAYGETRTEYSLGGDYLYDKSIVGIGYTNSDESDYTSNTWYFNVSQDFFGDLTTLSFGYSQSQDDVYQ
ncbi:MAG: DUF3570 domain-containing protein, partial [Halieaceae bacterium]|nr:DUF3570 domain-containing protein [Halieaceae bacterium]